MNLRSSLPRGARHLLRRLRGPQAAEPWRQLDPRDVDAHHELIVCAMFKNEAEYLREWIEFHRLVGVEKFVLYNNESSDDYERVLHPYVESGVVTLYDIPGWPVRMKTPYNACLQAYRSRAKWIAFIDLDEFLYPTQDDTLQECLQRFEAYPGLAVHWIMFNSSGHILRPDGLVIENFVSCEPRGHPQVKLVVQAARTTQVNSPHTASFEGDELAVDERQIRTASDAPEPPCVDVIRINHYWTKSVEEFFLRKAARGSPSGRQDRHLNDLLASERGYGKGVDGAIQRFVPMLHDRLAAQHELA